MQKSSWKITGIETEYHILDLQSYNQTDDI